MGYEADCTLRFEGTRTKGTARLEHKDLLFRGDTRLTIPLASITDAEVDEGVLRVRFDGRVAELDLGAPAAKWAARITQPPSRLQKLGVKPGMKVAIAGVPDAQLASEVRGAGAEVMSLPRTARSDVDLLFFGAADRAALEKLPQLKSYLQPAGAVWVIRPKGSALITESETMAAGKRAGLVDVKVVSFSDTHTAEKFVIPVAARRRPETARGASPSPRAAAARRRK